jgi:stress response protein YsnF
MVNRDMPNQDNNRINEPGAERDEPYDFGPADLPDLPGTDPVDADRERIELAEETLEPRVVRRQIGEVVIHKSIESQTLRNVVDLEREQVSLEELTVEEFVDEKREPWYEDDMLVIPLYEEVLVTERKLMLTKLVRVRHEVRVDQAEVEGEVRREVLDVTPREFER